MSYLYSFATITPVLAPRVGAKNYSLARMHQELQTQGIRVPAGFAVSTMLYHLLVKNLGLEAQYAPLSAALQRDDHEMVCAITAAIRHSFLTAALPADFLDKLADAYAQLGAHYGEVQCVVAVRSSATLEDLPGSSAAGQQETVLGVVGFEALVAAIKRCFASFFFERAVYYRFAHGCTIHEGAMSVGVQALVRSQSAGVAFSLEPESGDRNFVSIASSYGLGELLVQGAITPDHFLVHKNRLLADFAPVVEKTLGSKQTQCVFDELQCTVRQEAVPASERQRFSLSDAQVLAVAHAVITLEHTYGYPVDVEWAYDVRDGLLYILQARPETVHAARHAPTSVHYALTGSAPVLATGQAIGTAIASGAVCVANTLADAESVEDRVLVTRMTDPDWLPVMRKAVGIITDEGGRTCHAAIVSRELGIPAIVGTGNATQVLDAKDEVTLDCSSGMRGMVYQGRVPFTVTEHELADFTCGVDLMVNCADPYQACRLAQLPVAGVGLARVEFICASMIKAHPMALAQPERIVDAQVRAEIDELTRGYQDPARFFVEKLAEGIGMIAAAFYPRPVIVRLTDFKSNEYGALRGGFLYEHPEENPMIGFRGASRYCSAQYAPAFVLECAALRRVREELGFDNVKIMVPFVRTVPEARQVLAFLAAQGLNQEQGLEVYMMVEIPANVLLIDEFSTLFDGFSIGSNDLTQLTLGVDRDSGILTSLFDERDPAVMRMLELAIAGARRNKRQIGICGQAPSDYPELAEQLIAWGISSISLNADAVFTFAQRPACVRTDDDTAGPESRL